MAILEIEEKASSNIPQEIVEIIVSKLSSIKSLLRFKTVCKSWNNMISDPVFVQNHLQRSPNNLFVCIDHRNITGGRYSLVKLESRKFHTAAKLKESFLWWSVILCEYNGVLLLRDSRHYEKEYILWNPSTGREMRFDFPYARNSGIYLVNHGMCHDPATDDFKVVSISGNRYTIYSCKKNSWTKKKLRIRYHDICRSGIYVDGAIYWVLDYNRLHTELVYFDPRIDQLKTLQKPQQLPSDHDEHLSIGLTCLRGKLCLYCCDGKTGKTHIWIKEKGIGVGGSRPNWKELITFCWIFDV